MRVRTAVAGIGAAFVAGSILDAIGMELWYARVIVFEVGPPHFEPLALPTYAFATIVAFALGRAKSIVALAGFAALSRIVGPTLLGILHALTPDRRILLPETEYLLASVWAFVGIVVGLTLIRVRTPSPSPVHSALLVAGAYAIAQLIWYLAWSSWWDVLCYSADGVARCHGTNDVLQAIWSVAIGAGLGVLLARGTTAPEAALAGTSIALPASISFINQGAMIWGNGIVALATYGAPIITAATFVLVLAASRALSARAQSGPRPLAGAA